MTKLAALHGSTRRRCDLPAFPSVTTVADAVHAELDEWDRVLAGRGGTPDPALAFSLRWLRRHIPPYDGPPVLVQGDTGPGNFMYSGGRVTAVVDWELAHLGDPMDDIAWLSLRATQEPFPDFPTRLREYEELSGNVIDEARVHYYQVMAETKLQVMSHRRGGDEGDALEADANGDPGGRDVGNAFIYQLLHRRLWLEALADGSGLELTPAEDLRARDRHDHDWMYDAVLGPAAGRHRATHVGPVGPGAWQRDRSHRQVPGAGRHVRCLLRCLRARRPGSAARVGGPNRSASGGRTLRPAVADGTVSDDGLPAHAVASGRPRDGAGPSIDGGAGRPALAGAAMSQLFGVDLDLAAGRAHVPGHPPRGRRLPRRRDDRPLVGDRDVLVLLERARAQARWLDVLPGPAERQPLQRRGVGVGRRARPTRGSCLPGRVLGAAAPAARSSATCATSSGRTASMCVCSSR